MDSDQLSHRTRPTICVIAAVVSLLLVRRAQAHENGLLTPSDLWTHWNWDAALVVGLCLTVGFYAYGVSTLWTRAGRGRGVQQRQVAVFSAGMLVVAMALLSPLDALSGALFSAHMAQHLLLMVIAAPLLILAVPQIPLLWALPLSWRHKAGVWQRRLALRQLWRALTLPLVAWMLHAGMMWLWHLPALYRAALNDPLIHALEHVSFLGSGLLYWWIIIHPRSRVEQGYNALSLFAMAMQSSLLGALMTFARVPWYPDYQATTAPWGLTPLEDQQLAGLLMWLPTGLVYLAAIGYYLSSWLREAEPRARLAEGKQETRSDVA